jgi:predicted peptidase
MSLLLAGRRVRPRFVAPTPAQFVTRTLTLPASAYYGTDASSAQPEIAPGGVLTYQVFVPSSAARAAMGWGTFPHRVLIVLHGDGEKGFDGTGQMMGSSGTIPQLLGWGANQNGSLAAPSPSCPLLVIFPQRPLHWTGSGGTDGNSRGRRVMYQLIDATLAATLAEWGCDPTRIYLTGLSGGGFIGYQYLYQRVNRGLGQNIAAFIATSSCLALNATEGIPGIVINPATEQQAAIVQAPIVKSVPAWEFNSQGDATVPPSWYGFTPPQMLAAGHVDFQFTEFTTEDHTATWGRAHGTVNMAQTPWSWMLTKHL